MSRTRYLIAVLPLVLITAGFLLAKAGPTKAISPRYPDLRTVQPRSIRFDTVAIDGATHHVLRFTTTIWNAGEGPLELRGETRDNQTLVYQRIYDDSGTFAEQLVGEFVYHETHNHWHFENFAQYELWTKGEYDEWEVSGRQAGEARWRGSKTTGQGESFCIRDSRLLYHLPGSPEAVGYRECGHDIQGVSVGWADTYPYRLPDQWIDVGQQPLPNGDYVLRLIADPDNLLYESEGKSDQERESSAANEAVMSFSVRTQATEDSRQGLHR